MIFFRHNDIRTDYPYSIRLAMPKGISWQRNDIFCASRTVWICTLVYFLDIMTQGQIILIAYASLCLKAYLGKGMTYFTLRVLFGFVLCTLVYFFRQNETKGHILIFFNICLVETKVSSWQRMTDFQPVG